MRPGCENGITAPQRGQREGRLRWSMVAAVIGDSLTLGPVRSRAVVYLEQRFNVRGTEPHEPPNMDLRQLAALDEPRHRARRAGQELGHLAARED